MSTFLILGCGYTGERVARRLLDRGEVVAATTRESARLRQLASRGAKVTQLDLGEADSSAKLARITDGDSMLHVL